MVDIHSHILPFVDDGCANIDQALSVISDYVLQGVDTFVFTPHYRKDEYEPSVELLKETFNDFAKTVNEKYPNVKCYLGEEIFCDYSIYDLLKNNKVLTLNGTDKVLLEFNYTAFTDIADYVYNLKYLGYVPVIAHIERYDYINDLEQILELKENGALIQVNASGLFEHAYKKKVLTLIKNGLVDFICGDAHFGREIYRAKAYKLVSKKFSKSVADKLFDENAKNLILK